MYRMILVDDEAQIRKGLRTLLAWEEFGVEIVGEASDGAEALAMIERLQPEICIADIRMPNTDGLTLLRRANTLPQPPKFLMLSGYDQFEYVKTAMRLGALNYLLKPVDLQELALAVQEVLQRIDDEAARKQQFDESMKALRNNTLNRLLHDRIEVRELREKCQLVDITLRCNNMAVAIVRPVFNNADASLRWIVFESLDICNEVFNRQLTAYVAAVEGDDIAIIIKNPEGKFDRESLEKLLESCTQQIRKKTHCRCGSALGTVARSFRELPASFQAAMRVLEIRRVWGEADIQAETVASMQQTITASVDPAELAQLLQQGQMDALRGLTTQFFHYTLPHNHVTDATSIKYYLIEFVVCILQAARSCFVPEKELMQTKKRVYSAIRGSVSVSDLEQVTLGLLEELVQQIQHLDDESYSQRVQYVVRYLHQHYQDCNISLKTLADKLDINSAYLGRKFSVETGAFFSDYLNNIRVQQAKRLLETTTMKVADIAEYVGFSNVSYFSTIYKKITGERPGAARSSAVRPEDG